MINGARAIQRRLLRRESGHDPTVEQLARAIKSPVELIRADAGAIEILYYHIMLKYILLRQELGREPTVEEIAQATNSLSADLITAILELQTGEAEGEAGSDDDGDGDDDV